MEQQIQSPSLNELPFIPGQPANDVVITTGRLDDLEKDLNLKLATPYRVIIEAGIRGDFSTFNTIQRVICAYLCVQMRTYAKKNPKYREYVNWLNELGHLALEGRQVQTRTTLHNFDFKDVFEALNILSGGKINKGIDELGDKLIYPVANFPIRMKKEVFYPLLEEWAPGLIKGILGNKLTLYITTDFQFAVEERFWQCEGLCELIGKHRKFDTYHFGPDSKLYVLSAVLV